MKYKPMMIGEVKKEKSFGIFEFLILMLMLFVLAMYFFQGYVIKGPSMRPTYNASAEDSDEVLVQKYFYSIRRGSIIVFKLESQTDAYIKRVIAIEGDTIMFVPDTKDENVVRLIRKIGDSWSDPIDEDYIAEPMLNWKFVNSGSWKLNLGEEITVPKDCYFVMGDNRNQSTDSRYFGFVKRREVLGKVTARITDTIWSKLFIKKSNLNDYINKSWIHYGA